MCETVYKRLELLKEDSEIMLGWKDVVMAVLCV